MTVTVCRWPSRRITTGTARPTGVLATIPGRTRGPSTFFPSKVTMTSPGLKPARAAGESSLTDATRAPCVPVIPNDLASSSVRGWIDTPSHPRVTLPVARSWPRIGFARSTGIANPMPWKPPELLRIAELMPTASPRVLMSGPPELPGLMAASVWMKSSNRP